MLYMFDLWKMYLKEIIPLYVQVYNKALIMCMCICIHIQASIHFIRTQKHTQQCLAKNVFHDTNRCIG